MKYDILINGARRSVEFTPPDEASRMALTIDGRKWKPTPPGSRPARIPSFSVGDRSKSLSRKLRDGLLLRADGREFQVEIFDPRSWRRRRGGSIELEGRQQVPRPCPGKSCACWSRRANKWKRSGPAGHRSDENAERNPFAQIGNRRTACPGRADRQRRRNSGDRA